MSGAVLGSSWGRLGVVLGRLGTSRTRPGGPMETPEEPSWSHLGPSRAILGPSKTGQGAVLARLGHQVGAMLAPKMHPISIEILSKIDLKFCFGGCRDPKWKQNGTQDGAKINELVNFMKIEKPAKTLYHCRFLKVRRFFFPIFRPFKNS